MNNSLVLLEAVPAGRILGFDTEFLIELGIQWLNTLILTFVLAYFLYKPVKNFMHSRSERIRRQIEDAGGAEQKALTMKGEYEGKLRDIELERARILDAARKQASDKSDLALAEARRGAEMLREHAVKDIEMEQERVRDQMKKEIVDLAAMLAGRFTAAALDKKAQDELIGKAISEMGEVKWLT